MTSLYIFEEQGLHTSVKAFSMGLHTFVALSGNPVCATSLGKQQLITNNFFDPEALKTQNT